MKKYILISVFIIGFYSVVIGQIERNKNSIFRVDRTELGVGLGTTFYFGDYNEFIPFVEPRYYATVLHRYSFNLLYSLRTSISFGNIAGNSINYEGYMPYYYIKYYDPNKKPIVYFSRNFIDFNTGIELGFNPFEPVSHRLGERFTPYLFLGLGVTILYTDSYTKSEDAYLASYADPQIFGSNDANSGLVESFNIPIGIGIKYSPWVRWTIGAEWQIKKTFNDDIDRFNNLNPSEINNNKKGSAFMNTDWMSYLGVSLSYRLAVKSKCPTIRKVSPSKKSYQGINRNYNLYDNHSNKKKKKN